MLVDKSRASRRRHYLRFGLSVVAFGWLPAISALTLSHADATRIGRKIWQNECNATVAGLTSWNEGEKFASLGIGHFIWYPKDVRGPFDESFPKFLQFISNRGAKLPPLLLGQGELDCPWNSRVQFLAAANTGQMKQLRRFLVDTIDLQAQFLVARLEASLPKMMAEAAPDKRAKVEREFHRVAATAQGGYALVDYVNFKGEGILDTERYRGQGWGLLQVLEEMEPNDSPLPAFARSAESVLRRRVQNSPPQRREARWLPGWLNRIGTYTKE